MKKIMIFGLLLLMLLAVACTQTAVVEEDTMMEDDSMVMESDDMMDEEGSSEEMADEETEAADEELEAAVEEESMEDEVLYTREGRVTDIRFSNTKQVYEGQLIDQESYNRHSFETDIELKKSDRVMFTLSKKGDVLSVEAIEREPAESFLPETVPELDLRPVDPDALDQETIDYIKANYKKGRIDASSRVRDGISEGVIRDLNRFVDVRYEWNVRIPENSIVYYLRDSTGKVIDIVPQALTE